MFSLRGKAEAFFCLFVCYTTVLNKMDLYE